MGNNDSLAIDAVGLTSFVVNYCPGPHDYRISWFNIAAVLSGGLAKHPLNPCLGCLGNLQMLLGDHVIILFTTVFGSAKPSILIHFGSCFNQKCSRTPGMWMRSSGHQRQSLLRGRFDKGGRFGGAIGVGEIPLAGPILVHQFRILYFCVYQIPILILYQFTTCLAYLYQVTITDSHRSIRPAIIGFMKVIQTRCQSLLIC